MAAYPEATGAAAGAAVAVMGAVVGAATGAGSLDGSAIGVGAGAVGISLSSIGDFCKGSWCFMVCSGSVIGGPGWGRSANPGAGFLTMFSSWCCCCCWL